MQKHTTEKNILALSRYWQDLAFVQRIRFNVRHMLQTPKSKPDMSLIMLKYLCFLFNIKKSLLESKKIHLFFFWLIIEKVTRPWKAM